MAPFTIHKNQKPSDDDRRWQELIEETNNRNVAAANACMMHIENLRMARHLGIKTPGNSEKLPGGSS